MKWEDLRRSQNVEDRRGQNSTPFNRRRPGGSYRMPGGSGGLGGGGLFGLIRLLLMLPGMGRIVLLVIGGMLLFQFFGGLGLGDSSQYSQPNSDYRTQQVDRNNASVNRDQIDSGEISDQDYEFMTRVLGSTEDFWHEIFQSEGRSYREPQLVIYERGTMTGGCGIGQAQAGPFYCPADETVYIDLSFWEQLSQRFGAPGDFAQAYVLAHEVGQHIQNELGIMDEYQRARRRLSEREGNALNVRLELQADYFAGAWAKYAEELGILDEGDIEEALQAAFAVGDDTIQEQTYGRVVQDSFTHGTAEQRQAWFMEGYRYGDLAHSDTFNRRLSNE